MKISTDIDVNYILACNKTLQDLLLQKQSLQNQLNLGIIEMVDATQEVVMINTKELKIKKQLVNVIHVKSNGKPRSIAHHGPTSSYPEGYVYTKLEGGKIVKAKDLDSLYIRLYEIYYGQEGCIFTVRSIFEKALEEKQATENPKESTIRRYRYEFTKFFSSGLQDKDIRELTELDIKIYTQQLVNTTTIKKKQFLTYKGVLNLVFGYAFHHRIISENPVQQINNAAYLKSCDCRTPKAEDKILSPEEIQALIDDARLRCNGKYYVYYYALCFSSLTGVRVGELCALKWADIDFKAMEIHIHTQLLCRRQDGHYEYYIVNYLKNERGISQGGRLFPLTEEIQDLLQELRSVQSEQGIQSEYIFCQKDGSWMNTREFDSFLRKLCQKHNLSVTNNHALRMSFNSNVLIPNGVAVTERAKLLGHSVATNLNHYSYAQKDYLNSTRNILNKASENHREPFSEKKEPFSPIPFKKKKNPQMANL